MRKFLLAGIPAAMLAMALSAGAADMATDVQQACSACHSMKRICLTLAAKDHAGWQATVDRMVHMGAKLPADEIPAAVDYLTSTGADQAPFCR